MDALIDDDLRAKFWARVEITETCWRWKGKANGSGYGRASIGHRRVMLAHRLSYQLTHGAIPDDACVLHRCDNPICVRPEHLFLGDRGDNARDMAAKGRQHLQRHPELSPTRGRRRPIEHVPHGADHPAAKLTTELVVELRSAVADGESRTSVSKRFGISLAQVGAITSGRQWKHAGGPRTEPRKMGRRKRQQ